MLHEPDLIKQKLSKADDFIFRFTTLLVNIAKRNNTNINNENNKR